MMQPRLEALRRLATLYGMVEEMHSIELQRAAAAVLQAQSVMQQEASVAISVGQQGRRALQTEDRLCWAISGKLQESSLQRKVLLEQRLRERVLLKETARQNYVASHIRREQMRRIQDDVAEMIDLGERRRVQAAANDRFLARRRWTDAREGRRLL